MAVQVVFKQTKLKQANTLEHGLIWGMTLSMLLHVAVIVFMPKPSYPPAKPPEDPLKVELLPPEAKPLPPPEPIKPEPPTPVKPQPIKPAPPKPQPTPEPRKPEPAPEPVVQTPVPVVAPPPPVIAAKPSVSEVKPEVVVPVPPPPPPEPVKATGPSDADIDAARNAFRSAAHRELKKYQRYPRIAADRGIEGEVKLNIHLDDNGNVTGIDVAESSGNASLDNAALDAAKKANLKSNFQDILRGRINNVVVTVSFKLAN